MLRPVIVTQFQGATKAWDGPARYSKYRFGRICTCIAKHCSLKMRFDNDAQQFV